MPNTSTQYSALAVRYGTHHSPKGYPQPEFLPPLPMQMGRKPHAGQGEKCLGFWHLHCLKEPPSLELLFPCPFISAGYMLRWCLLTSASEITLAYHLPYFRNQILVLSPSEDMYPRLPLPLFSYGMLNYESNCMQMVYQNENESAFK